MSDLRFSSSIRPRMQCNYSKSEGSNINMETCLLFITTPITFIQRQQENWEKTNTSNVFYYLIIPLYYLKSMSFIIVARL